MLATQLLAVVAATAATAATTIVIQTDHIHQTTSESFLGVTIDTVWVPQYNLSDPHFVQLGARFKGSVLRVGGTAADKLFLDPGDGRPPWAVDHLSPGDPLQTPPYTKLPMSTFDAVYAYAKATGMKLVWDLNALGARLANNTWDATNAAQLFAHVAQRGYATEGVLLGFQFGNEPFLREVAERLKHPFEKTNPFISGVQLGRDFLAMRTKLDELLSANG